MPYDIYSTSERVRQLQAAIADLRHAVNASNEAERGRKRYASAQGYIDHADYTAEIKANLDIADSYVEAAATKLTPLRSPYKGLVYQYKWVVGQAGVVSLVFTSGTPDTIAITDNMGADANVFIIGGSPADYIFEDGDKILVDGTTSNDGIYTVNTPLDFDLITVDETSIATETCSTAGASITLIRRGT